MSPSDLESQFHKKIFKANEESKKLGLRPNRFLEMVNTYGTLGTAKRLLATGDYIHEGVTKLYELGRLDLSVEAIVIKPEYKSLFTDEEIKTAYKRLKELSYFN